MRILLLLLITTTVMGNKGDPATDQIVYFKNSTLGPVGMITTSSGAPVSYDEATNTLNTKLINNEFFMDSITHVVRERIPERVVHAKGSGAFGYFEVTHDLSYICKADFLKKIGKKTPVAVRFSPAISERGTSDLTPSPRGFAIKFYTKGGNWDVLGFNTAMYVYKDPLVFPTFVHALTRNPATNLMDPKTMWDFITLHPESIHIYLLLFAGRNFPASYRNMPGFGDHTFQVENEDGKKSFIRMHILPDDGIKNLTSEEAMNISAMDPDYLTRDLARAIYNGKFPSWTVYFQIATEDDVEKYGSRIFDVTRTLSLNKFPLYPIGKLVLDRNPKNFHAEIEQLAFCPGNLVPGISGAPDKLFEARRLTYREAQSYRLGINSKKIPVNCPFNVKTFTYVRDGVPPVKDNEKDIPNYYPNTFNGPVPYIDSKRPELISIIENTEVDNFDQVAELYAYELTKNDRIELIKNIQASLNQVTTYLQDKTIKIFTSIHPDLGYSVARSLNKTVDKC